MARDLAVVSAADANFFDLLQAMVRSLRDKPQGRDIPLYVFDIGLTGAQRSWLAEQGAGLHVPEGLPYADSLPAYLSAFLSRCRIPQLFPGHQVYLWIDADAWVQHWEAVDTYFRVAMREGFAIAVEADPAYDGLMVRASHQRSFAMFGLDLEACLRSTGPLNAGVFAGRADSPHWTAWQQAIGAFIGETQDPYLLFLLDQTALYLVCTHRGLRTALLPASYNWLAHFALPMAAPTGSDGGSELLRPLPPHEPLGIVHQAGNTKGVMFRLRQTNGGFLSRTLAYQSRSP
jgi:hypothetical protein